MLVTTFRTIVHAQPETVWELLRESMERPQSYLKGIEEVKILEKGEDWVVREVHRQGTVVRQRLSADNSEWELRNELLDHPAYTGWTAIRVIPASVQNPMAPLDLECTVKLERKSFHLEGMLKSEEQLLAELKEALNLLKEKAEEQEKRS
jgi:hypothetical protein